MTANKKERSSTAVIAGLIVCIITTRTIGFLDILPMPILFFTTILCIGLCVGWGVSVNRRIVQKTVRKYMLGISVMAVFWFVTRSIKYYFIMNVVLLRYMWYSYYIPMQFMPLFGVFISICVGKSENYCLKKWKWLLLIPTVFLAFVLTNDFHQLVFIFPEGTVWSDADYQYGLLYYVLWASQLINTMTAFFVMSRKCRLERKKQYLPAVLILLLIAYNIAYINFSGNYIFDLLGGDLVIINSLLIIAILESTIRCGLIQTNNGYKELFEVGTVGAQIVDNDLLVHYTSANARTLTKETMRAAYSGAVHLDGNTMLKGAPIVGGHVFWQEDITDLTAVLQKMEENKAAIEESNHIEEENLRVKREIHALREKNRLYDLLQTKIAPQIAMLDRLFMQYNEETDEVVRRKLLGVIAVVGAYIKRSGNLLFIGEKAELTDTAELSLCMEESFANLSLMGIECAIDIPGSHGIATKDAIRVYDTFEQITEAAIDTLHSVWLKARILEDSILFRLELECEVSLAPFSQLAESTSCEDGVWSFVFRVGKAGEA